MLVIAFGAFYLIFGKSKEKPPVIEPGKAVGDRKFFHFFKKLGILNGNRSLVSQRLKAAEVFGFKEIRCGRIKVDKAKQFIFTLDRCAYK